MTTYYYVYLYCNAAVNESHMNNIIAYANTHLPTQQNIKQHTKTRVRIAGEIQHNSK